MSHLLEYYKYQNQDFECGNCSWKGKGESLTVGDVFDSLFEVHCPECMNKIGNVLHPSFDEVLKYGSNAEKLRLQNMMTKFEIIEASQLESVDELPNIDKDDVIIFRIKEENIEETDCLVIYADGIEIWRELSYFEYFDRYIEIAKILKQKYGSRMTDLVTDEFVPRMYGDCSLSDIQRVKAFRKSLSE
ncbi:MAG: hypothetical protein H3C39_01315 [Flavobacteriia bacterium]|nr:hypothetical protein [Flavobacteriia bacterium]